LNEITDKEWEEIDKSDSIGFNSLYFLRKVNITFYIVKELGPGQLMVDQWQKPINDLVSRVTGNPYLKNSIFLLQGGFVALASNRLMCSGLLPSNFKFVTYWVDRVSRLPDKRFQGRLVHRKGTLCSAISLAAQLGYEEIVLIGVDLNNRGYFWAPEGKTMNWSPETGGLIASDTDNGGGNSEDMHSTVKNGVVNTIGDWALFLEKEYGTKMYIYNKNSLLSKVLPLFRHCYNDSR